MVELSPKKAVGYGYGKFILIGEHAVVYGKPAIAFPFPVISAMSTVEELSSKNDSQAIQIDCSYYVGPLQEIPKKLKGISLCIHETLKAFNNTSSKGINIRLHSTIPIGRGLGSSAAIAIAIVRSLYTFHKQHLTNEKLMELVHIAETYAHGNPSGIDMAASSSDHPIWFQKGTPTSLVKLGAPLHVVVADTGRIGDTRSAVSGIKEMSQVNPSLTQLSIDLIEHNTFKAKTALVNGDIKLLGESMDVSQRELTILGVSDPGIDHLVKVAKNNSALGAKLTGGGRGGCILALAKDSHHAKELENALIEAGAHQTWKFEICKN